MRTIEVHQCWRWGVCVCVCHGVCEKSLHDDTERQMSTTVCTTPDFMFSFKLTRST